MAKYCSKCGAPLSDYHDFCGVCGNQSNKKRKFKNCDEDVVSLWKYVGCILLFSLGGLGFVLTIIFAVEHNNLNIRNLARAYLIIEVIAFILFIIIYALLYDLMGYELIEYLEGIFSFNPELY